MDCRACLFNWLLVENTNNGGNSSAGMQSVALKYISRNLICHIVLRIMELI